MDIPVSLPLDSDGFLRRECPTCEREFKWHDGVTDNRPADWNDPLAYWCPLCGRSAGQESWWTPTQLEYMERSAAGPALEMIADEIDKELRGIKGLTFKKGSGSDLPEPPVPMVEPDDMMQITSPCHAWEPVKVPENSAAPYYCLACGEAYAI